MMFKPFLALLTLVAGSASAIPLAADGEWSTFDVDDQASASGDLEWIDIFDDGAALSFDFSIAAGFYGTLTVVDGGFAGDRFLVTNGNDILGKTSSPGTSMPDSVGLDFDAALADPRYSNASFTLGAGTYSVGGYLIRSATFAGVPLNTTVGAVRLTVSPVPEPATALSLLAGLGLFGFLRARAR
jgi:PEP-CTERM motif